MKQIAESNLNHKVTKAVVAVPSNLNYYERENIKRAGESIGLNIIRIMNEGAAAGLSHSLLNENGIFAFCTVNGDNLGLSIVRIESGITEVLSTISCNLKEDYHFLYESLSWKTDHDLLHDMIQNYLVNQFKKR